MATKYKVVVNDHPSIAKVVGTVMKVVKKGPGAGAKRKRVLLDYKTADFETASGKWVMRLKKAPVGGASPVVAHVIEVVVLDRFDKVIDGYVRRRKG